MSTASTQTCMRRNLIRQNGCPEIVRIELRAIGAGPPTQIRVRRLLKCALRSFGLRCTKVEPGNHETPDGPYSI